MLVNSGLELHPYLDEKKLMHIFSQQGLFFNFIYTTSDVHSHMYFNEDERRMLR